MQMNPRGGAFAGSAACPSAGGDDPPRPPTADTTISMNATASGTLITTMASMSSTMAHPSMPNDLKISSTAPPPVSIMAPTTSTHLWPTPEVQAIPHDSVITMLPVSTTPPASEPSSTILASPNKVSNENNESPHVPKVGMNFESEDQAYEFYNYYAGKIGFSIRKSHSRLRRDGTIYQKHIVCSNQGERGAHSSHDTIKENATTRTSCDARVQFSICRKGIWRVQKVVLEHNHYLASPNKRHILRSQRRLVDADKMFISQMREAGIRPAEMYNFFKQWYGGAQNVPFLRMDCNNHVGRERKKYLEVNDAQTLLEYLKNRQLEDPSFFYAIQLDEEDGRIANFFWADGQSIMDYTCFGDVVSFDTTFQTNKFEMPFAPLLGTNHHKQTILFGAALIFNETIDSFVWLFSTFLTAMSGKEPTTIFTDQCAAMARAISIVFSSTKHRLCLWHIYENAGKHLSHVISKHREFLPDFKKCVYEERSVAHFVRKWNELLSAYNLEENSWLKSLYDLREKWASVFRHDSFSADMTSTQRSEGMNNVFKKKFRKKLSVSELLEEYDKCAASLRENELFADYKSRHSDPVTYIQNLPMLKTAAESYTRRLYSDFEEQFKEQFSLSCKLISSGGTVTTYRVLCGEIEDEAIVVFNSEDMTISCSCKKYESMGLLCKHAIRVFNVNEVFVLPPQYLLNRWTKYAKRGLFSGKCVSEEETLQTHAARISRKATSIAMKCSISKELLTNLEEAMEKLDMEADNSLSQIKPVSYSGAAKTSNDCVLDTTKGRMSFRVPPVVKGPKSKRLKSALVKKKGNKTNKGRKKKGENPTEEANDSTLQVGDQQEQLTGSFDASSSANNIVPNLAANVLSGDSSTIFVPFVQGEYTGLLLGAERAAGLSSSSRRLDFDEVVIPK